MTTLHIENTLHDFDSWKTAFDKYDRVRADNGVRSYRIRRRPDDPQQIVIDLEFDDRAAAEAYTDVLAKIWSTPSRRPSWSPTPSRWCSRSWRTGFSPPDRRPRDGAVVWSGAFPMGRSARRLVRLTPCGSSPR